MMHSKQTSSSSESTSLSINNDSFPGLPTPSKSLEGYDGKPRPSPIMPSNFMNYGKSDPTKRVRPSVSTATHKECTERDCPIPGPHSSNKKYTIYSRDIPMYILELKNQADDNHGRALSITVNFAQHKLDRFWDLHGEATRWPMMEEQQKVLEGPSKGKN